MPLRQVVLLAPAEDDEGRHAFEPAVSIDARHAIRGARAVKRLRLHPGADDVAQLLRATAAADRARGRVEYRPARDHRHVLVADQRDAMRPQPEPRQQPAKIRGGHRRRDDAGKATIGRVVAAREHRDPGAGDAPEDQLARPCLLIVLRAVRDEEIAVVIAHLRLGRHAVAEHHRPGRIRDPDLGTLQQPRLMLRDQAVHLAAIERQALKQIPLQMHLHLAQQQLDLPHRRSDALVEQQRHVLDGRAHLLLLALLRGGQCVRQQAGHEDVERQHGSDQGQDNRFLVVMHASARRG